jgi:CheY-like chemotaxis protein
MSTVSQSATTGATILMVEDNASARMALETLLEVLGFQVLAAADAFEAEAIFTAQAEQIDLLISDMLLPHINGPELYDRLKQRKPTLRCVLMSGYPLAEESDRLLRHGIRHWLQKPFTIRELETLLRTVLAE